MPREQLSRRDAIIRGGLAVAGLAAIHPGLALAVRRPTVGVAYRLCATGECSCRACEHHAANKLFATRAAAEHTRAHPGCRCAVVRAAPMSRESWLALFGSASELRRTSIDRRSRAVRRVLGTSTRASS